jgi:HAE1 family hydrophobic/amphiphilic exporter-1
MDTMAGLGLVVLVGVVVNNGIVMIDYVEQLRRGGMPRDEAIQVAAVRRLRPILMTALTTIVGLLPMAAGSSEFVGIPYAPLGRTLMGGMITSTLLTLLFVPYVYVVLDDMRASVLEGVRWALRRTS